MIFLIVEKALGLCYNFNGGDNVKKLLSVVLAITLSFCAVSQVSYATQNDLTYYENAFSDMATIDSPYIYKNYDFSDYADFKYYQSNAYSLDYSSKSLLNENQLKIYNAVMDAPIGTMSVTIDFAEGELPRSSFTQQFLSPIMNALCYDSPYHFFHAGYQVGFQVSSSNYVKKVIYNVSLAEVYTSYGVVTTTYTNDTIPQCIEELDTVLDSLTFDTSNRYNFVKDVHDYLCETITYPAFDSEYYVADCHDAYGALVNKYAVCQGYAEAFKLICDIYNIPCVYISGVTDGGGGHAWNGVQMDDGKWYLIDATWNDQGSLLFDDFFLCGLDSVDTYFGGKKFSVSHVANSNQFIPSLYYASDYYSCDDHFTRFDATYNHHLADEYNIIAISALSAENTNIYFNGMYVDAGDKLTGSQFTVTDKSGTDEDWTLALVGDPDCDGAVSVDDYSYAVNVAISNENASDTPENASCDTNSDGFVDVLDLVLFERAINGRIDEFILQ